MIKVAIFTSSSSVNRVLLKDLFVFFRIYNIDFHVFYDGTNSSSFVSKISSTFNNLFLLGFIDLIKYFFYSYFISSTKYHSYIENVNSSNFISKLQKENFTHGISLSFGQIFKSAAINYFNGNLVNVHSSLIPQDKGLMPNFWALYHKRNYTGVTLHQISSKLDQGKIIQQIPYPIYKNYSYFNLIYISRYLSQKILFNYLFSLLDYNIKIKSCYNHQPDFRSIIACRYNKSIK